MQTRYVCSINSSARGAEVVGVAQPVLEQLRVAGHRTAGAASGHTATQSRSPPRAGPLWDGPPDGGRGLEVRAIGAASEVDV